MKGEEIERVGERRGEAKENLAGGDLPPLEGEAKGAFLGVSLEGRGGSFLSSGTIG